MFNPILRRDQRGRVEQHFRVNQPGVFLPRHEGRDRTPLARRQRAVRSSASLRSRLDARHTGPARLRRQQMSTVRGTTGNARLFELAPCLGICVNAVYLWLIKTPMIAGNSAETSARFAQYIPLGRIGEANEVAELAAFLVSRRGQPHQRRRRSRGRRRCPRLSSEISRFHARRPWQ